MGLRAWPLDHLPFPPSITLWDFLSLSITREITILGDQDRTQAHTLMMHHNITELLNILPKFYRPRFIGCERVAKKNLKAQETQWCVLGSALRSRGRVLGSIPTRLIVYFWSSLVLQPAGKIKKEYFDVTHQFPFPLNFVLVSSSQNWAFYSTCFSAWWLLPLSHKRYFDLFLMFKLAMVILTS